MASNSYIRSWYNRTQGSLRTQYPLLSASRKLRGDRSSPVAFDSDGPTGDSSGPGRTGASLIRGDNYDGALMRVYDLDRDGIVTDFELANVALREQQFEKVNTVNLAASFSINAGLIYQMVDKMDANNDSKLSNTEVAEALLSLRRGDLVNVSDPGLEAHLIQIAEDLASRHNKSQEQIFDTVVDYLSNTNILDDNNVSNTEALSEILAKRGSLTLGEEAVLGTNDKYNKIYRIVRDTPGFRSKSGDDLVEFLLEMNKDGLASAFANKIDSTAQTIAQIIETLDTDSSGDISIAEYIDGYVKQKKGLLEPPGIDEAILASEFANLSPEGTTKKYSDIKSIVDSTMAAGTDDTTVANKILDIKDKGQPLADEDVGIFIEVLKAATDNDSLKHILGMMEPVNDVTDDELIPIVLASRHPDHSAALDAIQFGTSKFVELFRDLNTVNGDKIFDTIGIIDNGDLGEIKEFEIRTAILSSKRSPGFDIEDALLEKILRTSDKYEVVSELVKLFDPEDKYDPNRPETFGAGYYQDKDILGGLLELWRMHNDLEETSILKDVLYITKGEGFEDVIGVRDPSEVYEGPLKDVGHRLLFTVVKSTNESFVRALFPVAAHADKDLDGAISEQEYMSLLIDQAKGDIVVGDTRVWDALDALVPNNAIIRDVFEEFRGDLDAELELKDLVERFRKLTRKPDGVTLDPDRLRLVGSVIDTIYPNATSRINLYIGFDANHDDQFSRQEILDGLLSVRAGNFGEVHKDSLADILASGEHGEMVSHILAQIDSRVDGDITDTELVNGLVKLQQGMFEGLTAEDYGYDSDGSIMDAIESHFEAYFNNFSSSNTTADEAAIRAEITSFLATQAATMPWLGDPNDPASHVSKLINELNLAGVDADDYQERIQNFVHQIGVDTLANSIAADILVENDNHDAIKSVVDTLELSPDQKMSSLDLASALGVQLYKANLAEYNRMLALDPDLTHPAYDANGVKITNDDGQVIAFPDDKGELETLFSDAHGAVGENRRKFLEAINMFKVNRLDDINEAFIKIYDIALAERDHDPSEPGIQPLDPKADPAWPHFGLTEADIFDGNKISDQLLNRYLLEIEKRNIKAELAERAILKSNPNYEKMRSALRKYVDGTEFTEVSLARIAVDSTLFEDPFDYDAARVFLLQEIAKDIDLPPGTDINDYYRYYINAANVVDDDHDGKIQTNWENTVHGWYFGEQFNGHTPIVYDFNEDGVVDGADKDIFLNIVKYLIDNENVARREEINKKKDFLDKVQQYQDWKQRFGSERENLIKDIRNVN